MQPTQLLTAALTLFLGVAHSQESASPAPTPTQPAVQSPAPTGPPAEQRTYLCSYGDGPRNVYDCCRGFTAAESIWVGVIEDEQCKLVVDSKRISQKDLKKGWGACVAFAVAAEYDCKEPAP